MTTLTDAQRVAAAVATLIHQRPAAPVGSIEYMQTVLSLQRLTASGRPDLWAVVGTLAAAELLRRMHPTPPADPQDSTPVH
jgi:hypothetical protein